MKRLKKSDIIQTENVKSGTSAQFIGINKATGNKGVYKINGCMLGINNEDIREKLASDILNEIGKECAQIDLIYDENTGEIACFSNYIINEDEELVEPYVVNNNNSDDKIQDFIDSYIEGIKQVTSDEKFLEECKNNAYEKIYMGCILDTYDLKGDNLPFIHNKKTGEYKIAPWFDYGTAFAPGAIQKQNFFISMSSEEVLNNLFSKHYSSIKDIANNVKEKLDKESIEKIFSNDYVRETFLLSELNEIKTRFGNQVGLSNNLLEKYKGKNQKEHNKDKRLYAKIKSFFDRILRGNKETRLLNSSNIEKISQDNIDGVNLHEQLPDLVNTPQEIIDSKQKEEMDNKLETKEQEVNDIYIK